MHSSDLGKRPTEYLEEIGLLSHHLHCAHSVLLSPDEADLYSKYRLSACHCGFHNYSIGHPRVVEMWRRGIDLGLGTDGASSSGTLDVFQVAHVARIGQQVVSRHPWHIRTGISSDDMLEIATHGGARALGLGDELGQPQTGSAGRYSACRYQRLRSATDLRSSVHGLHNRRRT